MLPVNFNSNSAFVEQWSHAFFLCVCVCEITVCFYHILIENIMPFSTLKIGFTD